MENKRIYVSDLDGTLFNDKKKLTDCSSKIINDLIDKGLNFTIATAKSFESVKSELSKIRLKLPIITFDGAQICYPNGEIMQMNSLSIIQERKIVKILNELKVNILIYKMTSNSNNKSVFIKVNTNDQYMDTYLKLRDNDERINFINNFGLEENLPTAFVSTIGSFDSILSIANLLKTYNIGNIYINKDIYVTGMYWLKVSNEEAKKNIAIKKIMKLYNYKTVTAFGDSENDIDMLLDSDNKIVVENADENIKKIADVIIGNNNLDSVAIYLKNNWRI